jgi:hypothetical protein
MERETTASAAPCPTVSLGPHPLWIPLDYRGGELCRRDLRTDERRKTGSGPIGLPPRLDDPSVDVAAELVAMRDEERW